MTLPPLPPLGRLALLLDIDGTLLELAPAPSEVLVPPDLPDLLHDLAARLDGALALISGRRIEEIDALFPGLGIAVAGEHGAALRRAPDRPVERLELPRVPPILRAAARELAAAYPGVLLEEKPSGFVLHFRRAEAAGRALGAALDSMIGGSGAGFVVAPAIMAWEVRPAGVDKGAAVHALLERAPYAGRIPLFVGDDATDDDAIRAARALGGFGFQVGSTFGTAASVRVWLRSLMEPGEYRSVGAPCAGL
ncbi:MAG: trehalose-phosphatase [Acetobacteraceae bacterium]